MKLPLNLVPFQGTFSGKGGMRDALFCLEIFSAHFSLGTFGMASLQSEPHFNSTSLGSTTATGCLVAAATATAPESSRDAGEIAAWCWKILKYF